MINPIKVSQVNELKDYIKENSDKYNKLVIFGKSITNECTDDDFLEIAVQTTNPKDADNDEALLNLFCKIDDITDGKFDLIIINSKYNTSNILELVNKGEVVYE